ncbi:MAG TPA: hypothetical protein VFP69_15940 [Streptomyces sp.]|nr:hypothetical protein [Streptomyces sp.]
MVRWRPLRGVVARPVPEPVATPFVWAGAFVGSLVLVTVLGAAGGLASSSVALVALSLLAVVLGLPARFQAAPGIAVVCWMFLNNFAVAPRGRLSWDGHPDAARFAVLLVAAVLGTVVARIAHARGAHHRTTPGR